MKTVFIVIGSQGEYSDHSMWHVNAYLDKTLAEAEAAALNGFFDLLTEKDGSMYVDEWSQADYLNKWIEAHIDPSVASLYDKPSYDVIDVDLVDAQ